MNHQSVKLRPNSEKVEQLKLGSEEAEKESLLLPNLPIHVGFEERKKILELKDTSKGREPFHCPSCPRY